MQGTLTAEQDTYREAFRGWLADTAPPATVRTWLDDGDAATFESLLRRSGFAGVGLPEDLGGEGGGLTELALTAGGAGPGGGAVRRLAGHGAGRARPGRAA